MRHEQEKKVLRVGLIHNGRIVEERLFRKPENVSVGTSKSALFSVPAAGLPEKREIFVVKKGRYHLACGQDLPFRVTSAGSTSERRAPTDADSRLVPHASCQTVPLSEDAHGRVQIGEVTLLFQFVTPPPAPPRLQLPEMTMVRWSSRVDRSFTAIFSWVVMIHVGFVMAVQSAPLPKEPTLADVEEYWKRPTLSGPVVLPQKTAEDSDEKDQDTPEKYPLEIVPVSQTSKSPKGGPSTPQEIRDKVRGTGLVAILVANPPGGSALGQVLGGNGITAADAFKGIVSGNTASLDEKIAKGPIGFGHGDGGPVGIDDLKTGAVSKPGGDPGSVTGGPKKEVDVTKVTGVVEPAEPDVEGCLDPAIISRSVKSRLRLIQDCYEKELKKNPSLAGKVTIRFTIDGEGAVAEARVESDQLGSPTAADCILGKIRRLTFPKSDCGSVPVSYPFVFVKTQ